MNIYVESNSCWNLPCSKSNIPAAKTSCACAKRAAFSWFPAYSLAEPYETLTRRHRQRKRMKAELDDELRQLARTTMYAHRLSGFQQLTTLLIDSADEEAKRLEGVRARLLQVAEVIPLEASILTATTQYQRTHGLSPQDALVYAAVLLASKRR